MINSLELGVFHKQAISAATHDYTSMSEVMSEFSQQRRDKLLHAMGITQYELSRPQVMQGEIAIVVPEQTTLIVATDESVEGKSPVTDLILALSLAPADVMQIDIAQLEMLKGATSCPLIIFGTPNTSDSVANETKFQITTLPIKQFMQSPLAKKALWAEICSHEHHFFTD